MAKPVVGWREWVSLPQFCDSPINAKVDTGARTSALHAVNLEITTGDTGVKIARFEVHPVQRSRTSMAEAEAEIAEFVEVRSSSGQAELRPVVTTTLTIGDHSLEIDVTLTSRDEMGFRMLLGRTAIRSHFLVDPSLSYQQGLKP